MILFLQFFLAHILGDFVLQPDKWIEDKKANKVKSLYFYAHLGVHLGLLAILLGFQFQYWLGVLGVVIVHGCIDLAKLYTATEQNRRMVFLVDQLAHVASIILILYFGYGEAVIQWETIFTEESLLFLTAVVMLSQVSSIIIKTIISQWDNTTTSPKDNSLEGAGSYIGILERLLVFSFIISNHWAAVGYLLAAKSVFRFGDLSKEKDRKLTEYILIGTLLSVGFAIVIAVSYLYLLSKLNL